MVSFCRVSAYIKYRMYHYTHRKNLNLIVIHSNWNSCSTFYISHINFYIISHSASPEHYRCNMQWSNNTTLLIGWVDVVRVCQIRKRTLQEMINKDLPEFVVDPGNLSEF